MCIFSFCPFAWAPESEGDCSQAEAVLCPGDRNNFHCQSVRASSAINSEIVGVVPEKAERTKVPGAGFSPDAVPGNEAKEKEQQNRSAIRIGSALMREGSVSSSGSTEEGFKVLDAEPRPVILGSEQHEQPLGPMLLRGRHGDRWSLAAPQSCESESEQCRYGSDAI